MAYTTLALANVYGPRQNPFGEAGVVAMFLGRILKGETPVIFGDGEQTRDFVYVDDVVNAFRLSLGAGDGELFNIGTGEETSVNQLYRHLADICDFEAEPEYAPAARRGAGEDRPERGQGGEAAAMVPRHRYQERPRADGALVRGAPEEVARDARSGILPETSATTGLEVRMGFVDVHSHMLPGLDDGARSLEECLSMARAASRGGITEVIATPHLDLEGTAPDLAAVTRSLEEVNERLRRDGVALTLHAGAELRMSAVLLKPQELPCGLDDLTLNRRGKHLLVDLPMIDYPLASEEVFFQLQLAGYAPVLAHPERNHFIHGHFETLSRLVGRGVALQVNAGSLAGQYGRKIRRTGWKILERGLPHLVASDGHSPSSPGLDLKRVRALVAGRLGEEAARLLFEENPRRVLEGEPLEDLPPGGARGRTKRPGLP